jgi:hypothetical protein
MQITLTNIYMKQAYLHRDEKQMTIKGAGGQQFPFEIRILNT